MKTFSGIRDFILFVTGKTRAYRLYERVRRYSSLTETSICMLHNAEPKTPCPKSIYFCGSESINKTINFDAVKDSFCKRNKVPVALKSVDAVMSKDERFIFVEIKSWQNFERYQIKKTDNPADIKLKIEEKAKDFNLKKKIEDSIGICKSISHNEFLFDKIPVVYILVTDVDTVVDPLKRFRARLNVLAYKSVYIPLYTRASNAQLSSLGMDVRYVFCRKFDQLYDSI